ncbi:MAG: response regulator [Cyclobacteriaceae bacterium]|nr:response regulator [Cyclobacteriaceae bacterium SS2]
MEDVLAKEEKFNRDERFAKKVLAIVESDLVESTIMKALQSDQYDLMIEKSGIKGIIRAKSEQPDIIICDFDLPDMSAREVLEDLGNHGLLTFSPFIFLIGDDWDKKSSTVMDTDMDAIIRHSIVEEELVSVIDQAITDKLNKIDELNQVQHEFNESFIHKDQKSGESPEDMKKRLLIIQRLFPLIKLGRMSLDAGIEILDEAIASLDDKIMDANKFINIGRGIEKNQSAIGAQLNNIWLIDDDPAQNLLNRMLLKKSNPNWNISEFNDANRAFQTLSSRKPDLVFLDINMPGMSGFEFLKKLTVNKIKLNVIMLSSSISVSEIKESFNFDQVVNYLTKPMERDKVTSLLKSVINQ